MSIGQLMMVNRTKKDLTNEGIVGKSGLGSCILIKYAISITPLRLKYYENVKIYWVELKSKKQPELMIRRVLKVPRFHLPLDFMNSTAN